MLDANLAQDLEDLPLRDEPCAPAGETGRGAFVDLDIVAVTTEQNSCEEPGKRASDDTDAKRYHDRFPW